jgi:predicted phage baseplate assembly protein
MSRPPSPHPAGSTGVAQTGDLEQLDYLPLAYTDLLGLEQELAVAGLGRPRPAAEGAVEEADLAQTFMELSALVAHVLSVYQRHYAGEAFISTARAGSSLVRHAHRLAYQPDSGLAASGYVVLVTKDDVGGTVAAGLALASVPLGETKAQDYETREDLEVDAALNELLPAGAKRPLVIAAGAQEIRLKGMGYKLEAGDAVALVGPSWRGLRVVAASEDAATESTVVQVDRPVGPAIDVEHADRPPVLLAHPSLALRPFASDADPAQFPPDKVKDATGTDPDGTDRYWYEVQRAEGSPGYLDTDVYLSEQVKDPLAGQYVVRSTGGELFVLKVLAAAVAAVTLHRVVEQAFTTKAVTLTPGADGSWTSSFTDQTLSQPVSSHLSRTVTALQLGGTDGTAVTRSSQPFPAEWLADWALEAPLSTTEPNPAPVADSLDLPGALPALRPGRPLVFSDRKETVAQVVSIRRAELLAETTRIWWDPVTPTPENGWHLNDLKVLGNVARVSHGRTVEETLGGSDGVTAFQRFDLKESPVTVLPGVAGGEPELEVRVDEILWQRVEDFAGSGPDDRHYRSVTDEALVTTVVFGDGRNGAVPPSGSKNVTAAYRVGLGRAGDVDLRRVTRLKRAHPLLDRVVNVTPISGGAEPADAEAIRSQSTRWIRTFDRAVSVSDLADLALTMPGIARAASRFDQASGVVLVVATATGEEPAALDAVRAFLDVRRDVGVPLLLKGPKPRAVRIAVDLEPDPAYLAELVKGALRTALHGTAEEAPGMFTFPVRGLGQPAFLSELYGVLEAVPGVIGVRVRTFESDGTEPVADVIRADVDEWLSLAANDLTVTILAPGSAS